MDYRLYFLGPDCRICEPPCGFQAESDGAALDIAHSFFRSDTKPRHGFELWQGGRHVHTENC